jgi:hypothetical protein
MTTKEALIEARKLYGRKASIVDGTRSRLQYFAIGYFIKYVFYIFGSGKSFEEAVQNAIIRKICGMPYEKKRSILIQTTAQWAADGYIPYKIHKSKNNLEWARKQLILHKKYLRGILKQ